MTPLGKTFLAFMAIAVAVAGILALRPVPKMAAAPRLTAAQVAEMQPPSNPEPPRVSPPPANDPGELPPAPDEEPDFEDGSGS